MELNNSEMLRPRRLPCLNIVHQLKKRETDISRPGTQFHVARNFYSTVFPNCTVINVEKPPCFLRKFSPNGRYFIAFSSDQTSIEIYEFQGSAAAENILCDFKDEIVGSNHSSSASYARSALFSRFFHLKHVTNVSNNGEHLNRECSLFTENTRHIIVGSAVPVAEDPHPQFHEIYRNNESVSPSARFPLEDYSLHVIDLETGRLKDTRHFKCDKIFLSHNQGLYLYKDILAVLSVQQQTIHILQVLPDGHFVEIRHLGCYCYEDDQLILSSVLSSASEEAFPYRQVTISSLKHKLLVFLFKHAQHRARVDGSATAVLQFFQNFDQYRSLRMWRMQLLTESHLLIKYASEDIVTLRIADPRSQPSLFVVYDMVNASVSAVFENTSEHFLETYENFCDFFRNATVDSQSQFTCSPSSNIHARQIHQRFKQTIINAKFGGQTEAIKHLLAQLPISAQSYSCSPYLDLALFSYDDKWISVMERPKSCGDYPIRFYSRETGRLRFKIHVNTQSRNVLPPARKLVAFTFHPFEPFAISVQRTDSEYIVNFHIRHCVT